MRKVEWFIPKPLFCQSCLSYGHFKKYCTADKDLVLCRICTKPTHNIDQSCTKTCKHCKTEKDHQTADRNCPAFKYQCDIRQITTKQKLTNKEAKVIKMQQNPTPAGTFKTYKKTFADVVASSQEETTHKQIYTTHAPTTSTTLTSPNYTRNQHKQRKKLHNKNHKNYGKDVKPWITQQQ